MMQVEPIQKKQEFKELTQLKQGFLKSAANFVEKWIDTKKHPEAIAIIKERDAKCFTPEDNAESSLSDSNRLKIIRLIRKISFILLIAISSPYLQATENADQQAFQLGIKHYQNDAYQKAVTAFTKTESSTEKFYNLGNCYYRLNSPAKAAYHYQLALQLDPKLESAKRNLNRVEQENKSIAAQYTELQSWIGKLTIETYRTTIIITGWIILIATLSLFVLKPRGAKLGCAVICFILCLFLLGLSLFGYNQHPNKPFQNLQKAIIMQDSKLLSEPLEESQSINTATIASQCYIIADRGKFLYITLLNGEKGWIGRKYLKQLKEYDESK